jgi:hypothetical protein
MGNSGWTVWGGKGGWDGRAPLTPFWPYPPHPSSLLQPSSPLPPHRAVSQPLPALACTRKQGLQFTPCTLSWATALLAHRLDNTRGRDLGEPLRIAFLIAVGGRCPYCRVAPPPPLPTHIARLHFPAADGWMRDSHTRPNTWPTPSSKERVVMLTCGGRVLHISSANFVLSSTLSCPSSFSSSACARGGWAAKPIVLMSASQWGVGARVNQGEDLGEGLIVVQCGDWIVGWPGFSWGAVLWPAPK